MTNKNFDNWKDYKATVGKINDPLWTEHDLESFIWQETFMIDQIPNNDNWNTFATKNKLESENLYRSWGIIKENTKHYACIKPKLSENLKSLLSDFTQKEFNYNFLKLTPGNQIVWHYDTYATFVKFNNIKQEQLSNVYRTAVMMQDWDRGQMLQVGNECYTHWNKGDTFTWNNDMWHGMCNFGPSECIIAQITFLNENNNK